MCEEMLFFYFGDMN